MREPIPGLRPLFNKTKQPAKVAIVIAPGDQVFASDDVAEQLLAARVGMADGIAPEPPDEPAEPVDERAAAEAALRAELKRAKAPEVRARAEAEGIDPDGRSKGELVEAIVAAVYPAE
jgi:molybdopterin-guanine dinucleotide biosynthesis protein A